MILSLGQLLVQNGIISNEVCDEACMCQKQDDTALQPHRRLGNYLINMFFVPENTVYKTLAEQFCMTFYPDIDNCVNRELLHELSFDTFKNINCLPCEMNNDILSVVISDPIDLDTILSLETKTGFLIDTRLTTPTALDRKRQQLFEQKSVFKQSAGKISREYEKNRQSDDTMSLEEIKKRTESEPVVKMASLIFDEAIKLNASDIHIEPNEMGAIIRYRIDGMLTQHMETPRSMYVPLTSRIKIMADLDIAEKRVPQDGRIPYELHGDSFDFRVSTLPTHYGEKTVVRILKHDIGLLELAKLGIPPKETETLSELIEKPQGIIFVTGPTGSGKSSTLFGCLNRIKTKAINITTIENPIEYKIDGVNQVQINEKAGVTFATTLRSILRQDPDVILIGEIRDRETAEIAVQSSQTGHLVLSTLHTNDSLSAITRLRDLGIPGFLISSSLIGILAQRLVRTLCPHCKQPEQGSTEIRERWKIMLPGIALPSFYDAFGCDKCHGLGFKGRSGIFELAVVNDKVREMIADNQSEAAIRHYYRDIGMKTMIYNGIEKIEQGITTPEELLRVVMVEDIMGLKQNDTDKTKDIA